MKRALWLLALLGCDRPAPAPAPGSASPARFFLVGPQGARTLDAQPKQLLPRFGVALVEQRRQGDTWVGRTRQGRLLRMSDLRPANPSSFAGIPVVDQALDFGWAVTADAPVFARPERAGRPLTRHPRLSAVRLASRAGPEGWWRVSDGFMSQEDLRVPSLAPRPGEVAAAERWIDVDLATQTLVAYQGDTAVFATLIAGGVGLPGSAFATPVGVHRINAKLRAATMDNLEHTGVVPYSYEDVPFTQYIGRVALHGVFWHDRFGTPMSHGCINLSLADAEWLFAFTSPRLDPREDQARATTAQPGTVVRVR